MLLHNIGTKQLQNLRKHLQDNGPVPRQHGLTGSSPATTYPYEIIQDASHFLRNYAEVLEFHSQQREEQSCEYSNLSPSFTELHHSAVEACMAKDSHTRYLKYKSFISV